jgi:DNA-binding transcriptional LysR family regulator
MRLPQLEYVVAIAEEGSYTAASTRLTIAQPSLSQQVAALEKELGCQLFERLHRGVRLTPAGRAFLPEARATVLAAERARRAVRAAMQLEGGTLEIATVGSMAIGVVPDAVTAWHRAHPDVAINVVSYSHRDALEAAVASGVGDLAIGPPPRRWSGETTSLGREEFVVLLPADDPAVKAERISMASLAEREWVAFDRDHGLAEWLYAACARAGFTPRLAAELAEIAAVVRLAAAGLGPAFVPANVVPPGRDWAIRGLRRPVYRDIAAYARTDFPHGARLLLEGLREADRAPREIEAAR